MLHEIVHRCDELLNTAAIVDYSGAHNGLQLESGGKVTRIAAAVDAGEAVIHKAVACGCDLLIVHHGLLWSPLRFTGATYRKIKAAMDHGLAIYSSHLPLDLHPTLGNNAQLSRALGFEAWTPAFPYKGQPIGLKVDASVSVQELRCKLEAILGGPAHLAPGGPGTTRRIGIVSGGAGSEIAQVVDEGCDTFITGEGPHWSYTAAEELGVNVFYGGHYATETFGVKALAAQLAAEFSVPWEFIDHPTGL